ncbi:glycosyl transferase CpoA [Pediococcus acidilactici NGRI 0510Q]|uniref:glycosyltransferase family 4 protein n=1 Tax=Pediococcus acidilactici TaxID=1254 RepID=UPI00029E15F4|nr:glycosyltransferase family 4 protein [Pediococcus acidilactici]KRN89627.1 glycosyl transferase CpoA [Pediococcus acidilactici]QQC13542.1 glycosyltransferase family 4 protein [Pediococcus acidilactici]GAC46351.1 glycosyl transferase CpoA [Pediococcus acidilactici NGRI 0510Q]
MPIKVNMFSSASKVKGQGVGSAYEELIRLLKTHFPKEIDLSINRYTQADISHYHTIDPQFFASTFTKKRGVKVGYVHFLPETIEGSLKIPQPFRWLFYKYIIAFYKRMDQIVVVNPTFIDQLVKYGIKREIITYIPNFVRKDEFYQYDAEQRRQVRERLGVQNRFTILGIGQVQERKGVKDFIKLAQQHPEMYFVWAGGFSFGRLTDGYADLKKVVDNPPANLKFTGIVDRNKLVEYYNAADLFLLPSYNELFPMSVLEAFSCGTPVMLRDLDLYHSIIKGYYIAADNYAEMDQKLSALVKNPAQLRDYQQRADQASAEYSEDHLAEIWLKYYSSLLK